MYENIAGSTFSAPNQIRPAGGALDVIQHKLGELLGTINEINGAAVGISDRLFGAEPASLANNTGPAPPMGQVSEILSLLDFALERSQVAVDRVNGIAARI